MRRCSITVLLCAMASSTSALAATYHVDSGVATSGDGSSHMPWKAIGNIGGLKPGDTVLFKRGGTWASETLVPVSGLAGSPVTYGAEGAGALPVIRRLDVNGKSHVVIQDLEFRASNSEVAVIRASSYLTLRGCKLWVSPKCPSAWQTVLVESTTHSKFLNLTVEGGCDANQNDTFTLRDGSEYNLVEGCTVKDGGHSTFVLKGVRDDGSGAELRYNVVRNNRFVSAQSRPLEVLSRAHRNLIEGNEIVGGMHRDGICIGGQNFKLVTSNNIVRRNVQRDSYSTSQGGISVNPYIYGPIVNAAVGNRVYNNTLTGLYSDPIVLRTSVPASCPTKGNWFKNNLIAQNRGSRALWVENEFQNVEDNHFVGNLFFGPAVIRVLKVDYDVKGVEAKYPSEFAENLQADPLFKAAAAKDFTLQASSPAVDKGVFLTRATADGGGTSLVVDDPAYFMDGWGVIDGDSIQLEGQTTTARITKITDKTLTLSAPLTWKAGQGVALAYAGPRPDIGAFEVGLTAPPDGGAAVADLGSRREGGGSGSDLVGGQETRPTAGEPAPARPESGCGCEVTGVRGATAMGSMLALLLMLLIARRRRG